MQILSATEAVSPAIARTKQFLFTPFLLGRTWKLCASAYLSFAGTIFLPFMLVYGIVFLAIPGVPAIARTVAVFATLVLTAIYVVVFWLCGHLKFAFFEMVLRNEKFVAPAWRRCGAQARQWTQIKMLTGTAFTAMLALPAYGIIRAIVPTFAALMANPNFQPTASRAFPPELTNFMLAFYGAYFLVAALMAAYFLVISTVSSFVVPVMSLENAPVAYAWQRFVSFARREPQQLAAFVAVRFGLAVAGYFALILAYELVFFLIAAVVALVSAIIGYLLHLVGVPAVALFVLGGIVFGLLVVLLNGYVLCLALGPFFTFFEAHTLFFLGGRYPLLGEVLERTVPPPPPPPPPPSSYAQSYGTAYYVTPAS